MQRDEVTNIRCREKSDGWAAEDFVAFLPVKLSSKATSSGSEVTWLCVAFFLNWLAANLTAAWCSTVGSSLTLFSMTAGGLDRLIGGSGRGEAVDMAKVNSKSWNYFLLLVYWPPTWTWTWTCAWIKYLTGKNNFPKNLGFRYTFGQYNRGINPFLIHITPIYWRHSKSQKLL